nr:ABC transporter permease [Candidatus Gracilibacteria bacterium]
MSILEHLLQSWQNLRSNSMRAFLSILGLVIGVFSVTVMVSVGEGLQNQVLSEFESATTNTITVIAGKSFNPFETQRTSEIPGFTDSDINFFRESMGFITNITPIAELTESVLIKGEKVDIRTIAGSKEYMEIDGYKLKTGRFLEKEDLTNYKNVVVVTENVVKDYLGVSNEVAIGKELLIGDQYFSIVGVAEEKGGGLVDVKIAIVPITTAQQKITSNPFYPYLVFEIDENLPSSEAIKLVKYTLLKWQGATHMDDALFQVISTETMMEQVSNITNILQLALGGIGAISLIVGGIGVMNIMLVSVTERTREIGIRKAIGAMDRDILLQFLTESIVLGLIGCVIGVFLSWFVIWGLQKVNVPALLNLKTILIAVGFAGGTGIIFGVGPARKAAKMKPIDALRFE